MGGAQTGTGKTAAFTLPILNRHAPEHATPRLARPPSVRALMLAPRANWRSDRRVGQETYAKHTGLRSHGGVRYASTSTEKAAVRNRRQILVATPGRLLDHIEQKNLAAQSGRSAGCSIKPTTHARHGLHPRHRAHHRHAARELVAKACCSQPRSTKSKSLLAVPCAKSPTLIEVAPAMNRPPTSRSRCSACMATTAPEPAQPSGELAESGPGGRFSRAKAANRPSRASWRATASPTPFTAHPREKSASANRSTASRTHHAHQGRHRRRRARPRHRSTANGGELRATVRGRNYVHRIGRTGRAQVPAAPISFVSPDDGKLLAERIEKLIEIDEQPMPISRATAIASRPASQGDLYVKGRRMRRSMTEPRPNSDRGPRDKSHLRPEPRPANQRVHARGARGGATTLGRRRPARNLPCCSRHRCGMRRRPSVAAAAAPVVESAAETPQAAEVVTPAN